MPSREELLKIKAGLKFTWGPLFSRFGAFTPVQQQAIPLILDGDDCILASRTASGKTEAVAAPLVERLKREKWEGLSVLYVSPTRALVNDLYRRLEPPLAGIGVALGRKTGDTSHINRTKPPQVLITTPESFDSLLSRSPSLLIKIRAVVLDEIHLLDGGVRGDQVRLLLHRLRILRRESHRRGDAPTDHFQVVALSATVAEPVAVASRYCVDPEVVKVEGGRDIDADLRPMQSFDDFKSAVSEFRARGVRKALVFCGSRAECESSAAQMREWAWRGSPFGDSVYVHHASLDRNVRLDTEARFAQGQSGICFATSTLELGVDIGDVDLVMLVGPPYSINSFLQRVGRGNRRTSRTAVTGFYRSRREQLLFEAIISAAQRGEQDDDAYNFKPSVVVQQILSYLKQMRDQTLYPRQLEVLLSDPIGTGVLLNSSARDALVEHLVSENMLANSGRGGALVPGDGANKIYELCQENSNIEGGNSGLTVVDETTGRPLGTIQERNLRQNESFVFGSRELQVARVEGDKVSVNAGAGEGGARDLRYGSSRRVLPYNLARLLGQALLPNPHTMPAVEYGGGWHLMHFTGDVYGRMLSLIIERTFGWKSTGGPVTLKSSLPPSDWELKFGPEAVRELLRKDYGSFEKSLSLGRYHKHLPADLRQDAVEWAFGVGTFCGAVNGRKVTFPDDPSFVKSLVEVL